MSSRGRLFVFLSRKSQIQRPRIIDWRPAQQQAVDDIHQAHYSRGNDTKLLVLSYIPSQTNQTVREAHESAAFEIIWRWHLLASCRTHKHVRSYFILCTHCSSNPQTTLEPSFFHAAWYNTESAPHLPDVQKRVHSSTLLL